MRLPTLLNCPADGYSFRKKVSVRFRNSALFGVMSQDYSPVSLVKADTEASKETCNSSTHPELSTQ